jgi:hypothetical protein
MSRKRKKSGCGCGCGSDHHDIVDPVVKSRSREFGRGGVLFPRDIRSLLTLLAENDDEGNNRTSLVLDSCPNHCFLEDVEIIAVMDNTVVIRDCDKFSFVCIGCICEVIVDCENLLEGIFDERNNRR